LDVLRKLLSPLGALTMLFSCWLPWAEISCGTVYSTPTYWQLADYDHRLYWIAALAALVLLLGLVVWVRRSLVTVLAHLLGALMCTAAWCFLWIKREDVVAYQAQVQGLGGDMARLANDLTLTPGKGFVLYLVGALIALMAGMWHLLARRLPR
jgi:hypothetical protein